MDYFQTSLYIKEVRLKQRSDPCMSNDISQAIKLRDQELCYLKNQKSSGNHKLFCMLRNKVQYQIRKAKHNYFNDKIEECKNSSSELWKSLKKLGISKKNSQFLAILVWKLTHEITFDKKNSGKHLQPFFYHHRSELSSETA